jgi:hypothetical protein
MRRALAAGLFFGLLAPAAPPFLALPEAGENPSATDNAHMERLMRAWSQTADSEKSNWAWLAETWAQADPFDTTSEAWLSRMSSEASSTVDKARWAWLEARWAGADESERRLWAWLGSMWTRARAAVQPGTTRGDVLKVLRSNGYGLGSSQITEQYVMGRCPFIIVTALVDTGMKGPLNTGPPDSSARIEKIVKQELWPYLPLKPDDADLQHCQQLRQEWWRSSDTERAELSRRAKEWGGADGARRKDLAGLAGMTPGEELHWDWLGQRWDEAKAMRPGMSEADLFVVFQNDGGMQTIPPARWVLRRCDFIKIDVQFEQNSQQRRPSYSLLELPSYSLRSTQISGPRIEPAIMD